MAALENNEDPDDLILQYWAGEEREAPRVELVVKRFAFMRKLVDNTFRGSNASAGSFFADRYQAF